MMSVSSSSCASTSAENNVPGNVHDPHSFNRELLEQRVLPNVFKPGRYLGLEQGAYDKPWNSVKARMLLAFPDVYEIGASSYAIKLLYSVVNQHADYLCDRVYAPAEDMRAALKRHNLPLFGVESKQAMAAFDVVAVSLQYELNYTTVLGVLDAGQLPLRSKDRQEHHPIVLGGGPGASNPNPLLPFMDGFMLGDGEDLLIEVLDVLSQARTEGWNRTQKLEALAKLEGVLIPGVNEYTRKRIVDISQRDVVIAPLIPAVEAVHDRVVVEARRGCDRMCRFCQPAFINLPTRENDVEKIKKEALRQLEETGYEECSLLSLSIADYSQFKHLVKDVSKTLKDRKASLSLSSQRADRFSVDVAEAVQTVRKSTLTFAPEAGTPRLRDVINKNLTDADIMNAVTSAYKAGWNKVKLYYMIGLPTETNADLDGIVNMLHKLKTACEQIHRAPGKSAKRHLEINVTLSNFVPKPHTPFQWHAQESREQLQAKIDYLRIQFKKLKGVKANFTSPDISKLEAVISKGGPELADALELAYRNGAYLDAWDETQPFAKWFAALEACGIDVEAYTQTRYIHPDEPLPWDCMDVGLEKAWLRNEWERSLLAASTTPCFDACSLCGVCSSFSIWPVFTQGKEPGKEDTQDGAQQEAKPPMLVAPAILKPQLAAAPIAPLAEPEPEAQAEPQKVIVRGVEQQPLPLGSTKVVPEGTAAFKIEPTAINPSLPTTHRYRFVMEKQGRMKYISHLDWLRLVQRVFRKGNLPLAYTQGFNPRPKFSFSPAVPLFGESLGEWVEVFLTQALSDLPEWQALLNADLPQGGKILSVEEIPLLAPSLEKQLFAMTYSIQWACKNRATTSMIESKIKTLVSLSALPVVVKTKRGGERTLDILPQVSLLNWQPEHQRFSLEVRRRRTPKALGLSDEAMEALEGPPWIKPHWLLEWLAPANELALQEATTPETVVWQVKRTALRVSSELTGAQEALSAVLA